MGRDCHFHLWTQPELEPSKWLNVDGAGLIFFGPGITIWKINWKIYTLKGSAAEFPMLSAVAEEIFSAQATSAQSERDFSQAGLIRTACRAQISAKNCFMLNFWILLSKNGIFEFSWCLYLIIIDPVPTGLNYDSFCRINSKQINVFDPILQNTAKIRASPLCHRRVFFPQSKQKIGRTCMLLWG